MRYLLVVLLTVLMTVLMVFSGCYPRTWDSSQRNAQVGVLSRQHVCETCGQAMYFTGKIKTEWGKLFHLYSCPVGHRWWMQAHKRSTQPIVKNPCPVCGQGTYFTGKTYVEWGHLFYVYKCPVGHRSVKR